MYKLRLPGNVPEIESFMDNLIKQPYVVIPDAMFARRVGMYVSPLKKQNILGIYRDLSINETIAVLKNKQVSKHNGVGRSIEYDFDIPFVKPIVVKKW